jgi:hypothetical protein
MNKIETDFLERCIKTLDKSFMLLQKSNPEEIDYDIYRSASIKEFEIILEQCGKLLKKSLKPFYHSSQAVDKLFFKDVFEQSVLRSIISAELFERFLEYRAHRNNTAHDYGANFAEETLLIIPNFIEDAWAIVSCIKQQSNDN